MDFQGKDNGRLKNSTSPLSAAVFEPTSSTNAKERAALVEWLNSVLPNLSLPINASNDELRAFLIDGTVLCRLVNKLKPGSVTEGVDSGQSSENLRRFLSAMDEMRLPRFQQADLEKGSMKIVLECLLTLKTQNMPDFGGSNISSPYSASRSGNGSPFSASQSGIDGNTRSKLFGEHYGVADGVQREELSRTNSRDGRRKVMSDSKFQHALRSPVKTEPSTALLHHFGHKFHEVFQLKQGCYADIPAAKISEMMKSNSLDSAPTQSLLSVVNGILDESVERQNGEIPYRVACLLRKVVQEIERRISTQAEHLRTQNNLFKAREKKYQSRIRVLEALASGTSEETQVVMNQLQQIKGEKTSAEDKKRVDEQDMVKLMKEKDDNTEKIAALKQELDAARKMYEQRCLQVENEARGAQQELEERLKELSNLLSESRNRVKQLETFSESKSQRWTKKKHIYQIFTEFQLGALRELKFASQSIKQEVLKTQKSFSEESNNLGLQVKALQDAAQNYYAVLAENRKLHNELQELKGNIRVYCRIRPFLAGQTGKQSTIEYIGENGELIVVSPSKSGKEGRRSFKFNKVYSLSATQAEVFSDIQPLIQSVLDGYNVCIFAYGQTGSGKTYTMMGPERATQEQWGINYRALNDLFRISQTREGTFTYEIGVQMVEIYNEQVRDLLSSNTSQKSLGILTTTQPNGLAVPDASMYPVNSTSDVLELMDIGLKNRAKGSTALNERSSRSHSVVTIHIRGTDLKTGSTLRSSLHLVDLAGSERVDRSEVTGDRLKEAQHINKSLSALGDVIFALAQKSPHVPYRNSKLTQVLQSSLGGQAKTLMFVQLNPEVASFSETVSTLKFAERVSGVELGAAKSSKDGRDVRELMEQVSSLKDKISKKDEEIERLQLLKDIKNAIPGVNSEKRVTNSLRYGPSSSLKRISSIDGKLDRSLKLSGGKGSGFTKKAASDQGNYSDSDKHSISSSHSSNDDIRGNVVHNFAADVAILRFGNAEKRESLSDVTDSGLSVGTETDGSAESNHPVHEFEKPSEKKAKSKSEPRNSRTLSKLYKDFPKTSTGLRKSASGNYLATKTSKRWQ